MKPFIFLKKGLLLGSFLLFPRISQAVLPIASPNEPCMWPWTRPNITIGSKWEAIRCTSKDPYKRSCKTEIYHILDEKDGYVKYRLSYEWKGEKMEMEDSKRTKFLSCSYDSFKQVNK